MDAGRSSDAKRKPERSADGGTGKYDGACDGIFAGIVLVMLFALAFWVSVALPQAVDVAAQAVNGTGVFCAHPEGCDEPPFPRDIREEQPEPPLARSSPVTGLGSRATAHFAASFSDQS